MGRRIVYHIIYAVKLLIFNLLLACIYFSIFILYILYVRSIQIQLDDDTTVITLTSMLIFTFLIACTFSNITIYNDTALLHIHCAQLNHTVLPALYYVIAVQ
jgi:hypothetical protein